MHVASRAPAKTASLAKHPFWLDGGYDRDCVEACRLHPFHAWVTLRLGDVLRDPRDPDELFTICSICFVPRCGYVADEQSREGRCILPRHHQEAEHRCSPGAASKRLAGVR